MGLDGDGLGETPVMHEERKLEKGVRTFRARAGLASGEAGRESLRWQCSSQKVLATLLGCP